MLGLELADLLHEALVLIKQTVVLAPLCLDLALPAPADRRFFLLRPVAPEYPARNRTHDRSNDQQGYVNDIQFGHRVIPL